MQRGDAGDVGAAEGALAGEVARDGRAIAGEARADDLDRDAHLPFVGDALGQVDLAQTALGELLDDLEPAELFAWLEHAAHADVENARDLAGALPEELNRIRQRLERRVGLGRFHQRPRERALTRLSAEAVGLVAHQLGGESRHLVELEESLQFAAQEFVGLGHRRTRYQGHAPPSTVRNSSAPSGYVSVSDLRPLG